MNNPTFYMDAVVHGREDMEDFEGPLTLLIHLISKNKIVISDIKIGDICDQYIAYLDQMKQLDLEIASEFVQMASHLVYIKARTLLLSDQEIPELEQLILSMEELQARTQHTQVKEVLDTLRARYIPGGGYLEKPPEYISTEDIYQHEHHLADLLEALSRLVGRDLEEPILLSEGPAFVMPQAIAYSVSQKAGEIMRLIKRRKLLSMQKLFGQAKSKSEVVATFMAVLELCKIGSITFDDTGKDIDIRFTGKEADLTKLEDEQQGGVTVDEPQ